MKFPGRKQRIKRALITVACALLSTINVFAADAPKPSELNNAAAIMLLVIAVVLLLAIGMLSYVLIGAAEFYIARLKEKAKRSSAAVKTLVIAGLCLFTSAAFAGEEDTAQTTQQVVSTTIAGMSKPSFYTLVSVIGLEVIVLFVMLYFVKQFIAKEKPELVFEVHVVKEPLWKKWWSKMNSFKPVQEETAMMMEHDYDGIRELDNNLPPWWLYGFYVCIIFAGVYLYRANVSHSAPSSREEYEIAMADAEIQKEAYLKSAANKVDENTVTLLTDAGALGEGKKIFTSTCAPCHGAEGQGIVGPNLTDDYWLHKGSVKDVFKTIKYGVPEKGMKSWKDDFSPVQIAQIASYIKSLHGSKPANAKEPQGELYKDDATQDAANVPDKKLAIN